MQRMRANILTLEEGERLLVPYLSTIRQVLLEAFARWQALPDEERLYLSTQARAFYIHDMAIGLAVPNFRGTKVQIVECNLLRLLNVEERAMLRFAKFGPGLSTSKNSTRQQRDFDGQDPLPGMPVATHLVAGYVLDPLETKIERMAVACPYGSDNLWSFDIDLEDEAGGTVADLQPSPDEGPRPLIRSRMEKVELPNVTTDAE
jgi:hypothetical protein